MTKSVVATSSTTMCPKGKVLFIKIFILITDDSSITLRNNTKGILQLNSCLEERKNKKISCFFLFLRLASLDLVTHRGVNWNMLIFHNAHPPAIYYHNHLLQRSMKWKKIELFLLEKNADSFRTGISLSIECHVNYRLWFNRNAYIRRICGKDKSFYLIYLVNT